MKLSLTDALIVVDVQNDYCEGGTVPVKGAAALAGKLSDLARRIQSAGVRIIASQDWHAEDHISFDGQGGRWPAHCVQATAGANFHPDLRLPIGSLVIRKGTDAKLDATSAFTGSKLEETLRRFEVERVFVSGVPAELTVLQTALDSKVLGFETFVVEDGIAPLTEDVGELARATEKLGSAGVVQVKSDDLEA